MTPFVVLDAIGRPLTVERFTFPDGQPHVAVKGRREPMFVQARIRNSQELVELLLLNEALRSAGATEVGLRILYLMGARMDRRMPAEPEHNPFTLAVVADIIRSVPWASISILDPHSDVAPALLRARPESPVFYVRRAIAEVPDALVVIPDAGAIKRIEAMNLDVATTQAVKRRNESTGKLDGFRLLDPADYKGRDCLIVDDLCDGGRTFVALAELMSEAGANSTSLYVTHGVFSRGFYLDGLARIFTTDSYCQVEAPPPHVTIFPLR